ncbi:MAG: histidinol-phosphate transaminase [Chloroflexota bacterium]
MSPTPVTFVSPIAPVGYNWEATDREVAERYGVPLEQILRFDLNTSPTPPELATRILAGGRFITPLSEYPPADYHDLIAAAANRYGVAPEELLVGAGADEVLDLLAKAFLPAGGKAVLPVPSYAMYRVLTEQRGASVVAVSRKGAEGGWAMDVDAVRAAARDADLVWLCSPNNPTGLAEPDGAIAALLDGITADAAAAGRPGPAVVLDEAYAEFVGRSLAGLRRTFPRLIVVRTVSKAYALAGIRVGFAVADATTIAAIAPYRPPGSVATTSVTVATAILADDEAMRANLDRVAEERPRLTAALGAAGWTVFPSVTNFVLVDFGTIERVASVADGLLGHGLVPRTFGRDHPLATMLRLTVRDRAGNERLAAAAGELAWEASR